MFTVGHDPTTLHLNKRYALYQLSYASQYKAVLALTIKLHELIQRCINSLLFYLFTQHFFKPI